MAEQSFGDYLENAYLRWQIEQQSRRTLTEFAAWLGFGKGAVSNWMSGVRVPDEKSAVKLAEKLGDEVYSLLGLPKPSPAMRLLIQLSNGLSEAEIEQLINLAEGTPNAPKKTPHATRRARP